MIKNSCIFTIVFIVLFSCGSGVRVSQRHLKPLYKKFTDTFINKPYAHKGKNYSQHLTNSLNLYDYTSCDTVVVKILDNEKLQLTLKDSLNKVIVKTFDGKFRKKGVYEYYLYKKRFIIPFIYGVEDIDRVRLALTKTNNLVVDNYNSHCGNIFIFAAGSTTRDQSFFKAIRNPDTLLKFEQKPTNFILMIKNTDSTTTE